MNPLASLITPFEPNTEGIFQIDYDTYAQAPGVRQSTLADMRLSPRKCFHSLANRKDETKALVFGRLLHTATFEPEKFGEGITHWVKPPGMSFATKEGKAWRSEKWGIKKLPILETNEATNAHDIAGMGNSLRENLAAVSMLECEGLAEVSALVAESGYGLIRKVRADRLIKSVKDGIWILDLKSTEDARREQFRRSALKYGYQRQAAYYIDAFKDLDVPIAGFLHLAVEKSPPYHVVAYRLTQKDLAEGRELYRWELELYAECVKNNDWPIHSPAYPAGIQELDLKPWEGEVAA